MALVVKVEDREKYSKILKENNSKKNVNAIKLLKKEKENKLLVKEKENKKEKEM